MLAGPGDRPIVFLDVDGTLIPFRAQSIKSALPTGAGFTPAIRGKRCCTASTRTPAWPTPTSP